jgi:hypothetical protein
VGNYKGRPVTLDHQKIAQMRGEGYGATEIARAMRCSRGAVYKALGAGQVCYRGERRAMV